MAQPKAKLAFKGRDRKVIKHLLTVLNQVQRVDTRRTVAATAAGVPAVLYATAGGVNVGANITALITRCTSALIQTVSQQAVAPPVGPGGG